MPTSTDYYLGVIKGSSFLRVLLLNDIAFPFIPRIMVIIDLSAMALE
jgi:hypothetical protein